VWDRFYHVTLLSDETLRQLLTELGLESEMKWVETKTGFYSGGRLVSMSNTWEFLRFPPLNLWQKFRLGGTIFLASKLKNWHRLEKVPVARWLRRWSGKGAYEAIWLPLLRSKLGDAYRRTSAAFIWAHISRMYKARRTGLKREMFGYVPGGYARVLDRLAEALRELGVEVRCSAPVQRVVATDDGVVRVEFGSQSPSEADEFDHVALTIPAPLIAKVCPQLEHTERRKYEDIEYLGIACASVLLKKPLSPYYVTNITDGWPPFTAVIEMTTIVDSKELGGHSLVYLPKYVAADDPAYDLSDSELEDRFLAALQRMHPGFTPDDVAAFRVARARYVMALPTINYSQRLPPMATSVPGVYAVNSAHILKGNLNVNETLEIVDEALAGPLRPAIEASATSRVALATTPE
ncbi:MAG TPA: NAD(P)/FAD-dependent oxidoreductase, partial [Lacipirellulaceae bacterium]|nr:NAD(P)/FAD-dependent oxidoreductase [Lacipirellulaceae bacterium]